WIKVVNQYVPDQELKADGGKIKPALLIHGMPRALLAIAAVLTYGEQKYEADSWRQVTKDRWQNAKYRHLLSELAGLGESDLESGLLHAAHEACNQLILLQLRLDDLSPEEFQNLLKFKEPPQDHKKYIPLSADIPGK